MTCQPTKDRKRIVTGLLQHPPCLRCGAESNNQNQLKKYQVEDQEGGQEEEDPMSVHKDQRALEGERRRLSENNDQSIVEQLESVLEEEVGEEHRRIAWA
jgi:hypothetical protein